jgi:hypothetical protein
MDPIGRRVAADPAVMAAMDDMTGLKLEAAKDTIAAALSSTDDRTLKGWVAVACWEDESGRVSQSVVGDGHSTSLETKGLLHSAVWTVAHND